MASGFFFPAITVIVIVFLQAAAGEVEMNMVFYMHDILTRNKETTFPVAGLNGSSLYPGTFGTLVVISDIVTKRPQVTESDDDSDNIVGRAHGVYVNTSLVTGLDFFMVCTIIFQNKTEYSGSTLEIQGTERFDQPVREYAMVGGTGKLRFARGYAVVTTESTSGENAVLRLNTTFRTH